MGKSSKKKKKADFQKVKLKVGKKLSKGDNVTNLSFKTRQIHLTQTIRTGDTTLPVTKRNLSLPDLLRQCDHHSVGIRVNATSGIKELILGNFSEFLIPSNVYGYGAIMKRLSSMLIDNESDVRHCVINLFKLMFSKLKLSSQKLTVDNLMGGSLFSHIHAYLCCAMNHIHEDVRLDSLILFDALLESFPRVMIQQTGDLLKNLIGMISSPISVGTKTNTVTQRLSMNPDSKLPAMKFRACVLLRIKLTLQVACLEVTESVKKGRKVKSESVWSASFDGNSEGAKQNCLLVTEEQVNKFGIIFKGAACDTEDYIIKASSLEDFIKLSIPVLLQCWKEAKASEHNETASGSVASLEGLEVMSLVASIIELLFTLGVTGHEGNDINSKSQMIPISFLSNNYERCFTQDLLNYFPYSSNIDVKPSKKRKKNFKTSLDNIPTQSSLTSLNLCICHVMSHFCSDHSDTKERPWLSKILRFVVKSFDSSPSPEHTRLLCRILRNIFQNPSLLGDFEAAFEAACRYYSNCKVKLPQKRELFNLFSFIFDQWDGHKGKLQSDILTGRYSYSARIERLLSFFLKSLPKLLLRIKKDSPAEQSWLKEVLTCISSSLNSRGPLCIREEMDALCNICDPASGLLSCEDEEVQLKLLFLLAQGPSLSLSHLKQVLVAVRRPVAKPALPHRKSRSLACQAITCITRGMKRNIPFSSQVEFNERTQAQCDTISDYLKFMFSLLIGMSREEMESLLLAKKDKLLTQTWEKVDFSVEREQWERHTDIASTVCQELLSLQIPASPLDGYASPFTFISNIEGFWRHALVSYRNVHIMSAYSLFKFICFTCLKQTPEKPSSELYTLTSNVMAYILASFYSPNTPNEKHIKEIIEQMKAEIISCLGCTKALLPLVLDVLQKQKDSSDVNKEEKQAAIKAIEFLMSDDQLKTRILDEKLFEPTDPEQPMDVL